MVKRYGADTMLEADNMMAFWSPEAVARAAELDDDPHGFIRAAAEFIAGRLQHAGAMSPADAHAWGARLAADAATYLPAARQRRAMP